MSSLHEQHLLLSDTHDIFEFCGDNKGMVDGNLLSVTTHFMENLGIVDKCCLDRVTIPGPNFAA